MSSVGSPCNQATLYGRLREPARSVLATLLSFHPLARHRAAVCGLPRSGTSWSARVLSKAPGVSYYYEPDHEMEAGRRFAVLSGEAEDKAVERNVRLSLAGRIHRRYNIPHMGLGDLLRRPLARTVLVKWVWHVFALPRIGRLYPDLPVLQTLRHPVPQFLSWRRLGWTPTHHLNQLLRQEEKLAAFVDPTQIALARGAKGFWEEAAALWAIGTAAQLQAHRPGWFICEHEWLCLDPRKRFPLLFRRLGLTYTREIDKALDPDRNRGGDIRDAHEEIFKWQDKIAPGELDAVGGVLQAFSLPVYRGLDPTAFYAAPVLSACDSVE